MMTRDYHDRAQCREEVKPPNGFEPLTCGLQNRCSDTVTSDDTTICENDKENSADYLALLERESPDLALLVKRWDTLPEVVRAGIMAMVRASDQPTD